MVQQIKCFTFILSSVIQSNVISIFISKKVDHTNNVQIQNADFDHTIYQEIEYGDLLQKVIMLKEVKELWDKNITYSQLLKKRKHLVPTNKVKHQKMLASFLKSSWCHQD